MLLGATGESNNIVEEDCCFMEDETKRWFNFKYLSP